MKGKVSNCLLSSDREETTLILFKEFNERDIEMISGILDYEDPSLYESQTGMVTFKLASDPFDLVVPENEGW